MNIYSTAIVFLLLGVIYVINTQISYLEKNNVLIIESINPEVSSKIRFEEIRIKKLCEQIGFVPKKIKCLVKKGY